MKAIAELTRDCLKLPSEQRLQLARLLIEGTEAQADYSPEVEAEWEGEIQERLRAVKNGTARSRPVAEVLADLDRRFPE
jgi:hypothetical protein